MAHFYSAKEILNPVFEPDVSTPAQARKAGRWVYPSVTTVLGIVKDAFLDSIYKPRMMVDLAREYPALQWRDIESLTYGTKQHPGTGETISSAEFGTAVHQTIEEIVNSEILQHETPRRADVYDDWALPFIEWIQSEGVKPVACECIVANSRLKIAGSVDFIGHDADGNLFLADYKCRGNTKGKAKVYDKDCQQLAIESYMLMKQHNLDYLPACRSVIIDTETKQHMHHEWSQEDMQKGIKVAKKCAELYWLLRMQ